MSNTDSKDKKPSNVYQVGLNRKLEAVISAHFMHDLNQHSNMKCYTPQEFAEKSLSISSASIFENLIPSIFEKSYQFILERAELAKKRAIKNFKLYKLNSHFDVGLSEIITEVMFDRQFLKGPKHYNSRYLTSKKIHKLIKDNKPIKMVILALPYKSSSPLKCKGPMPDFAEINFLLGLTEIAKTIDFIYKKEKNISDKTMASFTVISDGSRFNALLNEDIETIKIYQNSLRWWIERLNIANYVEILDYENVITTLLSSQLQTEKKILREKAHALYSKLMMPLLDPYNMHQTIKHAIELEPDPELSNPQGRYVPLFKSLIYIIKYTALSTYTSLSGESYSDLYTELTRHIFEPYTVLTENQLIQIEIFIKNPKKNSPPRINILEYFRQSMLRDSWVATINYLAEIRSDRDLLEEPIIHCFPDHIRWTIHSKPGQLAILTTSAFGDPVQSWHGMGVFRKNKQNKIKLYTLPALSLEGHFATPVIIDNIEGMPLMKGQPLFYIDSSISFEDINDFFSQINKDLTRKRKA